LEVAARGCGGRGRAYSLPRGERANTRTKDLIDIVLLIRSGKLDKAKTAAAAPPGEWGPVFAIAGVLRSDCIKLDEIKEGRDLSTLLTHQG